MARTTLSVNHDIGGGDGGGGGGGDKPDIYA